MSHYDYTSVRTLAQCLWERRTSSTDPVPDFQIVRDIMGYRTGLPGSLLEGGPPPSVSLLQQLRLAADRALDLNIISVGADQFNDDDYRKIDSAIAHLRDILAPYDICVRAIYHSSISSADADGYDHIADLREAEDLTHEFSASFYGMDVFVTRTANVPMVDAAYDGQTSVAGPRDGPYDTNRNGPMTGVVLGVAPTTTQFAQTLAWGVCRYLGAKSSDDRANLMFAPDGVGTALKADQVSTMKEHAINSYGCSEHLSFGWSSGW